MNQESSLTSIEENTTMADQAENRDAQFHLTFVEFLFSLAAAEIAMRFATVFDTGADLWSWSFLVLVVHLFLALLVIAASYIGWQKSKSSHRDTVIPGIISLDFFELILDVIMVILYFILVHLSEVPKLIENSPPGSLPAIQISLKPEAVCVPVIFGLYLLWDIVSKFPLRKRLCKDTQKLVKLGWSPLGNRGWISAFVFVFSILLAYFVWHDQATAENIIAFDISLIGLVILFRELKEHVDSVGHGVIPKFRLLTKGCVSIAICISIVPFIAIQVGWTRPIRDLIQQASDFVKPFFV